MKEFSKEFERNLWERLAASALEARGNAYAPYSGYRVGAALLTKTGRIYQGCNVENASYGATCCAERAAFFRAIGEGEREFCAMAVAGASGDGPVLEYAYPCGICRQVMQEFCGPDFRVAAVKSREDYRIVSLKELLPFGFGKDSIV